jgi:hypothetical protein
MKMNASHQLMVIPLAELVTPTPAPDPESSCYSSHPHPQLCLCPVQLDVDTIDQMLMKTSFLFFLVPSSGVSQIICNIFVSDVHLVDICSSWKVISQSD